VPYLLVLALSLLVGSVVYLATVRARGGAPAVGFGEPAGAPAHGAGMPAAGPGYAYLRVSTQGPTIRDRIRGFVGLVVLVGLTAVALALAIYQAGHLINQTIETFLNS